MNLINSIVFLIAGALLGATYHPEITETLGSLNLPIGIEYLQIGLLLLGALTLLLSTVIAFNRKKKIAGFKDTADTASLKSRQDNDKVRAIQNWFNSSRADDLLDLVK